MPCTLGSGQRGIERQLDDSRGYFPALLSSLQVFTWAQLCLVSRVELGLHLSPLLTTPPHKFASSLEKKDISRKVKCYLSKGNRTYSPQWEFSKILQFLEISKPMGFISCLLLWNDRDVSDDDSTVEATQVSTIVMMMVVVGVVQFLKTKV